MAPDSVSCNRTSDVESGAGLSSYEVKSACEYDLPKWRNFGRLRHQFGSSTRNKSVIRASTDTK